MLLFRESVVGKQSTGSALRRNRKVYLHHPAAGLPCQPASPRQGSQGAQGHPPEDVAFSIFPQARISAAAAKPPLCFSVCESARGEATPQPPGSTPNPTGYHRRRLPARPPRPAQAALRRAALPPRRRRAEPGGPSTSPPRGGERRGKRGSRAACLPSASLEPARFSAEEQPAAALRPAVPHRILGGDCCSSFSHRLLARRHAAPNGRAASGRPEAVSRGRGAGSRYPKEQRARLGPPRPSGEEEEKKEKEAGGSSAPTASWPRRHSRAAPVAQRRTPHASRWHRPGRQRPAPREHTCGEKNAARGSRWL